MKKKGVKINRLKNDPSEAAQKVTDNKNYLFIRNIT